MSNNPYQPAHVKRSSNSFTYAGNEYHLGSHLSGMRPSPLGAARPRVTGNLDSLTAAVIGNTTVGAAMSKRQLLISTLWFRYRNTKTNELKGDANLALLEDPGGTMTLERLLMKLEEHAGYHGGAFTHKDEERERVRQIRPDWTSVILGSDSHPVELAEAIGDTPADLTDPRRGEAIAAALDADVLGYYYAPPYGKARFLLPDEVAHFIPEPHPMSDWLGLSWISACIRDMCADMQADKYVDKFFEQGATPRLVVNFDKEVDTDQVNEFIDIAEAEHAGIENAHRTWYFGGGSSALPVGAMLKDLELKDLRGVSETHISARSHMHPVILGISEGLEGASLNAGNYAQIRRLVGDAWFQPYANGIASALGKLWRSPRPDSRLDWDLDKVLFLQQDAKEGADVIGVKARAISSLIQQGFDPLSAAQAVQTGVFTDMKHTGLPSVQVQQQPTEGE